MATKKKTKGASASKAKSAAKKSSKNTSGRKIAAGKKSVKVVAGKKTRSKGKVKAKRATKSARVKPPVTPVISHGPDLHMIPVAGEIHPARTGEGAQFEKVFKHNEEIALHMEQQRAKQVLATNRGGGKRIFKTPRHF